MCVFGSLLLTFCTCGWCQRFFHAFCWHISISKFSKGDQGIKSPNPSDLGFLWGLKHCWRTDPTFIAIFCLNLYISKQISLKTKTINLVYQRNVQIMGNTQSVLQSSALTTSENQWVSGKGVSVGKYILCWNVAFSLIWGAKVFRVLKVNILWNVS